MNKLDNSGKASKPFSWLIVFFGLAYFCQHFGQAGLITQPLTYYFKEVLHWKADAVATFFAVLTMPWMIKPLYGLISDYFPLFGYRRKSYLLLLNLAATGGFLWLTGTSEPAVIQIALVASSFCTAFSDVAIDGLMVELGRKTGRTAQFQSMQWLWFNAAAVLSSLLGGYFAQLLGPASAYKAAAVVTGVFPLVTVIATWFMVKEDRAVVDKAMLKETTRGLVSAFKSRTLWTVIAFIAFWQFSPSFGTPMYYHMTDNLKFSQEFIGTLGAIGAVASVLGALLFNRVFADKVETRRLMYWMTAIGGLGTLAYLFLANPATGGAITAVILGFVFGTIAQVAMLVTMNLAAEACPKRVEAMTFAVIMSVFNLSAQGSSIFGSWLYENVFYKGWALEHIFGSGLSPLILVSAAFTLVCLPLIRFLPAPVKDDEGEAKK